MKPWTRHFALVFATGFVSFIFALGAGAASGQIWSATPMLVALRLFGVGVMAAGMTLWGALRREEAGRRGLNPLLGLLLGIGSLLLVIGLSALAVSGEPVHLALVIGVVINLVALIVGVLAMIIAPAYPHPIATTWPDGGDMSAVEHHSGDDTSSDPHVP